ncbi:MAG: tRNA (guanosine(37)-N1)-methyltransferase TrmD [Patescibacteria group bacterium]|jgi:tRNA (guanine37-N1)-methyltransferase
MTFHIITIFPHIFNSYFNESILKRAQTNKLINIKIHNLRDWTTDKHKTVDDTPFGGGAGMVMKIEPLYKAVESIKYQVAKNNKKFLNTKYLIHDTRTILFSAKGKTWNQKLAKSHAKLDNIILICGRYEGVDERITKFIDEEISIGDYVLTGGEIGAMAIVDSITRLLPGALGNADSTKFESHTIPGILEHPQYTRPEIFIANGKKFRVPKVLLSGNHKKIADWRAKKSKHIRPL